MVLLRDTDTTDRTAFAYPLHPYDIPMIISHAAPTDDGCFGASALFWSRRKESWLIVEIVVRPGCKTNQPGRLFVAFVIPRGV